MRTLDPDERRRRRLARQARWRDENRAKLRAQAKAYREAQPDKLKAWRQANPDRVRAHNKARNPDKLRAKKQRYYLRHKATIDAKNAAIRRRTRHATLQREAAWRAANRETILAKERKRVEDNPEGERARKLKWAQANPHKTVAYFEQRRALLAGAEGTFTVDEWRAMLELHEYLCFYCGEPGKMTQDHVVPLIRGGRHEAANIVPACRRCNASKGTGDWPKRVPRPLVDDEKAS